MLRFVTELDGDHVVPEAAVVFCEALGRLNALHFAAEPPDASPCCAKCGGCELDLSAPLADARTMLAARRAHPASIVAYAMGRELAAGHVCRVVLDDDHQLALEREDGERIDPLAKYPTKQECSCSHGQASPSVEVDDRPAGA
jgi:hypothetical protein